jgi:hypothetical protein
MECGVPMSIKSSRICDRRNEGDPTAPKKEGENFFCPNIFFNHKYHKIENNFSFELVKKTFFSQNTKN